MPFLMGKRVRDVVLSTGATMVVPIYPLAQSAGHEKIRDCAMAVYEPYLADHPANRFVFGDSGGGGLAVYLTETLRERGDGLPTALVLLSPWLDMEVSDPSVRGGRPARSRARPRRTAPSWRVVRRRRRPRRPGEQFPSTLATPVSRR